MSEVNIYKMQLHEVVKLDSVSEWVILRVASGWIYTKQGQSVFVPYDNKFQYIPPREDDDLPF